MYIVPIGRYIHIIPGRNWTFQQTADILSTEADSLSMDETLKKLEFQIAYTSTQILKSLKI